MENYNLVSTIQELCKSRGISVKELEKTLGLSNGIVGKWADSAPSVTNLMKVAEYFKVSLDYLCGRLK